VRAIKDEPGFRLDFNPPLPPGNLYQQHRQQHDPPVVSRICYRGGINYRSDISQWVSGFPSTDASLSSFAKRTILQHFSSTHQTNSTVNVLNRYVGGGRLDGLLTQSPHTPVAGCTTTLSREDGPGWHGSICRVRFLVLTDSSHPFIAWISLLEWTDGTVDVRVATTEAPVADAGGAFKHCFPVTTLLARVALGRVAPYVIDRQVDDDNDDDSDSDGHGGWWDDMDGDSDGEDSGGTHEGKGKTAQPTADALMPIRISRGGQRRG